MSTLQAKNSFIFLFIASLNIGLVAGTSTNRTFIMPRPILENLSLRYATWHNQIEKIRHSFGCSSLQFTTFYQHSTERSKLGRYFGYFAPGEGQIRDYIKVANTDSFDDAGDDIWAGYIVHDKGSYAGNLNGTLKFKPKQEIYGVQLDYHQGVNFMNLPPNKVFFEISVPLAKVKNDMNLSPEGELTPISLTRPGTGVSHPSTGKTLLDYLKGQVYDLDIASSFQQQPLSFAKIENAQSRTGIADVAATIGCRIINEPSYAITLKGYCTIPSGNRATGEYLFEPICGNGGHWFLGFGPDVELNIWKDGDNSFDLFSSLKLSYGLEGTERRTLGIKKDDGSPVPFSQYYLVGKKGTVPLFPFANISTLDLEITPKWQFEALVDLSFNLDRFHINLGYNFFGKERETAFLKRSWLNDAFAISSETYETKIDAPATKRVVPFLYKDAHIDANIFKHSIQEENLDFSSSVTPSQTTHKLYASLGYVARYENFLFFNLWGAYEYSNSNSALSNYSFGANFSMHFS